MGLINAPRTSSLAPVCSAGPTRTVAWRRMSHKTREREARAVKRTFVDDSLELIPRRTLVKTRADDQSGAATEDVKASTAASSTPGPSAHGNPAAQTPELLSTLSLFLVAFIWGTNPVCLRYTYLLDQPPSPAALAAVQAAGAAVFLTLLTAAGRRWRAGETSGQQEAGSDADENAELEKKATTFLSPASLERAGAELGGLTFLANAATISAFQHTPASRGAFLLRLTAVFTPGVSKLAGEVVSSREWVACCIALLGGILISVDGALNSEVASSDLALGGGDALMIVSALLWSVQTVRLGRHAQRFEPLPLARNQTLALAALSGLWLLGSFTVEQGSQTAPVGSLLSGSTSLLSWAAVLWPAIGPWGIATALQVNAQNTVTASRTQIILATDPIWATLLAGFLGGAEQSLGGFGWLGAALVLTASTISKH